MELSTGCEIPINYLFVGNPGSGKSTILNSMIGEPVFKSGVSFGGGLTYEFDEHRRGIHTFMDTPGLADVKLRKQAAAAITEALKKGGNFKVVFVVTLEAGRVRPADKTTIQLILESAPITTYGLLINKVPKNTFKQLYENPDNRDPSPLMEVCAELWAGTQATPYVVPILKINDLEDEENAIAKLPWPLIEFLERKLPSITIQAKDVHAVQEYKFDEMTQKFEKMLEAMKNDNDLLRQEIYGKQKEMATLHQELEELRRRPRLPPPCCLQ